MKQKAVIIQAKDLQAFKKSARNVFLTDEKKIIVFDKKQRPKVIVKA